MNDGAEAGSALVRAADRGIHCFPIPTPFAVGTVNVYLIEGQPLTLVDCGPNAATALAALVQSLRSVGYELTDLDLIVVTHQHMDHVGLAAVLAELASADLACLDVMASYLESWDERSRRDDDFAAALMVQHGVEPQVAKTLRSFSRLMRGWGVRARVGRRFADGDVLRLGSRDVVVRHLPGHSPSDTIFHDRAARTVIAGDHLLRSISSNALVAHPLTDEPWRGPRPQPLLRYRESMRVTRELDVDLVLGGHGGPITDHRALIDERLAEQEARAEQLLLLLERRPSSAHELATELWHDVALTQTYLTLSEVLGHLDLLLEDGRAVERDDGGRVWYEAA